MTRRGIVGGCLILGLAWGCGSTPPPSSEGRRASSEKSPSAVDRWLLENPNAPAAEQVVTLARSLLATPYRYAGAEPGGFDCSGLTSYVFSRVGVPLPRTARNQAQAGRWVAPDELSAGDLVFFGDDRVKPYHVGVVVSNPGAPLAMIHSSSSRGVIETEVLSNSYWLPRLRFGRRILERD